MAEIETLGILEEINSLVSDRLLVVSYKWLSRNFLVSSNSAKRLLEEYVQKHSEGLEVMYTVAGWLKKSPPTYRIQLVPWSKLSEAKEDFSDNCSVQVYSVQASIPDDPALLWNTEFVQAEELFKQPTAMENCLRDNRFCGVSNSWVKRHSTETPTTLVAPHTKVVVGSANTSSFCPEAQKMKPQKSSAKPSLNTSSVNIAGEVESENFGARNLETNPASRKNKASLPASSGNKGQSAKISAGSGGSIANFWSRASLKSNFPYSLTEANNVAKRINDEALDGGNSDEDGIDVHFNRVSNGDNGKKRRVIIDDSDDEADSEDAFNLESPDPPEGKSIVDSKLKSKMSNFGSKKLKLEEEKEEDEKPNIKEDKLSNEVLKDPSAVNEGQNNRISTLGEIHGYTSDNDASKKNKVGIMAPAPPKRKVLKTRIDERGREVTEVIWEGEELESKQSNDNSTKTLQNPMKETDDKVPSHIANRAPAVKKPPATGNTAPAPQPASKAGNKKGGNAKDPKQGNIRSFFKRV